MTFSYRVKQELCQLENNKTCCDKSQLYALLLFLKFFIKKEPIYSENASVLRKISELLATTTGCISEVEVQYLKKNYLFKLCNDDDIVTISDFFKEQQLTINNNLFECEHCKNVFLRSAFLSVGTISDPKKQYKCEFVFSEVELSEKFLEFINQFSFFNFKLTKRKNRYVVYSKDSSVIESFLTLTGAKNSAMEFMQEKMYKEAFNNINRQINFENANMDKTISASAKHIAAIANIFDNLGKENLPTQLLEVATLRLENPEMSLGEMSKILEISRSSVNNRLNKLISISEKL